MEPLTPAQKKVLELFAEGKSLNDMATILDVTKSTIRVHIVRIKKKMGGLSTRELVAKYYTDGEAAIYRDKVK